METNPEFDAFVRAFSDNDNVEILLKFVSRQVIRRAGEFLMVIINEAYMKVEKGEADYGEVNMQNYWNKAFYYFRKIIKDNSQAGELFDEVMMHNLDQIEITLKAQYEEGYNELIRRREKLEKEKAEQLKKSEEKEKAKQLKKLEEKEKESEQPEKLEEEKKSGKILGLFKRKPKGKKFWKCGKGGEE